MKVISDKLGVLNRTQARSSIQTRPTFGNEHLGCRGSILPLRLSQAQFCLVWILVIHQHLHVQGIETVYLGELEKPPPRCSSGIREEAAGHREAALTALPSLGATSRRAIESSDRHSIEHTSSILVGSQALCRDIMDHRVDGSLRSS